jgi:hypothetical protein
LVWDFSADLSALMRRPPCVPFDAVEAQELHFSGVMLK